MTLQIKKSGNYTYLYAIKSFRKEDGKCTTKVVEKFGTVEELREKLNGADPIEWARARVAEMTAIEKEENKRVVVEYGPKAYIRKGEQRFIKAEHCTTDGVAARGFVNGRDLRRRRGRDSTDRCVPVRSPLTAGSKKSCT